MGTETKVINKVIHTHSDIVRKTKKLARRLNTIFKEKEVVLITIMTGGLPFTNELMKHLKFDIYMDFASSSSYHLNKRVKEPKLRYEAKIPLTGKDIIIVDEIIDTGKTVEKLARILQGYQPASISVAALVVKPNRKNTQFAEYYCFEHKTDDFLVGFGLDWDEKYRNLPYIAITKKE